MQSNFDKTVWPWYIRLLYWHRDFDLGVLGIWRIQAPLRFRWQGRWEGFQDEF